MTKSMVENDKGKREPVRFNISLLKPKKKQKKLISNTKKTTKNIEMDNSKSCIDLDYYPKSSATNGKNFLKKEVSEQADLIVNQEKMLKRKFNSNSIINNADINKEIPATTKSIDIDYTGTSQLVDKLKKRKIANSETRKKTIKQKLNKSESSVKPSHMFKCSDTSELVDKSDRVEKIQSNNTDFLYDNTVIDDGLNKSRSMNEIDRNEYLERTKLIVHQPKKRRMLDLDNTIQHTDISKLFDENCVGNSPLAVEKSKKGEKTKLDTSKTKESDSTKSSMDNNIMKSSKSIDENSELVQLIAKQKKEPRRKLKSETINDNTVTVKSPDISKLIDERATEKSELVVEQSKNRRKPKCDISKKTTLKKFGSKELNKSELIIPLTDLYTGSESSKSISKNSTAEEIDSNSIIDNKVLNNDPETTKLINENLSNQNYEEPQLVGKKSINSKLVTRNASGNSKSFNENLDTPQQLEESKKRRRKELHDSKSSTDNTIMNNNSKESKSLTKNEQNQKDSEEVPLIVKQKKEQRRKSNSKTIIDNTVTDTSKTIDDDAIENSRLIVKQPQKIGRSKSCRNKIKQPKTGKKKFGTSESFIDLSDMHNNPEECKSIDENGRNEERQLYNLKSINDNAVIKNNPETPKSINDYDRNESLESTQLIDELVDENAINDKLKGLQLNEPAKRGRGRPPKSTTPKIILPNKTIKINVGNQLKKRLNFKPRGKLTKESIKGTSFRKIPQNRLNDALEMLTNEDHPIWEDHNVSCNAGIHRYWEPRNALISDQNLKLKYARQFLLRRDWLNLSKVLCLSTIDTKQKTNYYPLLTKYATICVAHTDKEQFNKFIQFLVGMDDASSSVMRKCTTICQENEE